jgi:hypothetical protein
VENDWICVDVNPETPVEVNPGIEAVDKDLI